MKFLYFGDMHERPVAPENRKDDFRKTVIRKVSEIKELGIKYGISAFLQPGDFLNEPKFNYDFLSDIIKRWSTIDINKLLIQYMTKDISLEDMADELKKATPMIGIVGNHELYGGSLKTFDKTSLNFLKEVGLITLATKENPVIFTTDDGIKIAITGTNYHNGMDKPKHLDDYIVEEKLGDYHIHIVHGYLTNKSKGTLFRHTLVDDIAYKTKADLTISGHDHIGFPLMEVDGKYFVNPGAPIRSSNDLKEIRRRPKVLLIDVTKEKGLVVKEVPLKSAQKGEEVLDRSKILKKKEKSAKIEEIKSLAQKANMGKGVSITEIIEEVGSARGIDENLKKEVLDKVLDKMSKLSSTVNSSQPYHITKLVLENFQSHEYSEFEFDKGLNVLIGESRQGKTAVLRALSWIYENNGRNSRRFIRTGKEFARATIYLSTGYVISRIVEIDKSGKNGYEIYDPATGETEYCNTKHLPVIQEMLGFNNLTIDTGKDFPLNFLKQGTSWFFIGDKYTGSDRAKMLGSIYGTHHADAVIKELEGEVKKLNNKSEVIKGEISKVDKEINKYNYLPQMEKDLAELEYMQKDLEALMEKREAVAKLLKTRESIEKEISDMTSLIKDIAPIKKLPAMVLQVKEAVIKRNEIEKHSSILEQILNDGREAKMIADRLKDIKKTGDLFKEIKSLQAEREAKFNRYTRAMELSTEQHKIVASINNEEGFLKKISVISELSRELKELNSLMDKRNKLKELVSEKDDVTRQGREQSEIAGKAQAMKYKLIEEYKDVLIAVGKCPVCHGTIDNATVNRIVAEYSKEK